MEEGLIESTGFAFGIDALLPRVLLGPLLICILPCHRSSFRPAMPGFLESLSLIPLAMRMGEVPCALSNSTSYYTTPPSHLGHLQEPPDQSIN